MNENEIDRIAAMGNALRPDWPAASLRSLLGRPELAAKTRRDVAVALAWVACESQTKTPARVLEAGPWWKATVTEGTVTQRPPRRDEECATHAGQWATNCHGCAADKLAGTPTTPPNLRRPDTSNHLARLRAELASTKARLCGHGIDRARGRCADCEKPDPTPRTTETEGQA